MCFACNKTISVYVSLSDFGDAPVIKKCKYCDTLYAYTIYYERSKSLEEQLKGINCVNCSAELSIALVLAHTHIKCCNTVFSLDDDFSDSFGRDSDLVEDLEVYWIES